MNSGSSPYIKLFDNKGIHWNFDLSQTVIRKAYEEDKLIFIHIGSNSNLIARESALDLFFDDYVTDFINKNFIPVMLDADENIEAYLSGIDMLMMNNDFSTMPMNIFTLPSRRPLVCFSNCDRDYFINVASNLSKANKDKKSLLIELSDELNESLFRNNPFKLTDSEFSISDTIIKNHIETWLSPQKNLHFLYKIRPFTPNPYLYSNLLDLVKYSRNSELSNSVVAFLDLIQYSGSFDPVEGGIFRQSIDSTCTEPLFEKTLSENAKFLELYSSAYKFFGDETYKETALKIFEFIKRDLSEADGGLYNSTTLMNSFEDSVYYTFSINELSILFPDDYRDVAEALGFNLRYNKMDQQLPVRSMATYLILNDIHLKRLIERRKEHRGYFVDKRFVSGNMARAVKSIAKASENLNDLYMYNFAKNKFNFLVNNTLNHNSSIFANSELISTILYFYSTERKQEYLDLAVKMAKDLIVKYYDPSKHMFTDLKSKNNLFQSVENSNSDFILPSTNSTMLGNVSELFIYTCNQEYREIAESMIRRITDSVVSVGPLSSSWASQTLKYLQSVNQLH